MDSVNERCDVCSTNDSVQFADVSEELSLEVLVLAFGIEMKQCRRCFITVVFLCIVLVLFGEGFSIEASSSAAEFCHNPSFLEVIGWREASSDGSVAPSQLSMTGELALLRFRGALRSAQLSAIKQLSESFLYHRLDYGNVPCINCSCKSGKRYFKHSRRRINGVRSTQGQKHHSYVLSEIVVCLTGNSRAEDARCDDVLDWPLVRFQYAIWR